MHPVRRIGYFGERSEPFRFSQNYKIKRFLFYFNQEYLFFS
jgi:hypothetical protein